MNASVLLELRTNPLKNKDYITTRGAAEMALIVSFIRFPTIVMLFVLLVSSLSGCYGIAPLTTARPIGHGKNVISVAGSFFAAPAAAVDKSGPEDPLASPEKTGMHYSPMVDVMYRRGFGNRIDLGVGLAGIGPCIDLKINLVNTTRFALSVSPGVGWIPPGGMKVDAPVLVDVDLSKRFRLAFSAKYTGVFLFYINSPWYGSSFVHLVGGTVGLDFAFSKKIGLMPFGGVLVWLNKPSDSASDQILFFTAGVAVRVSF